MRSRAALSRISSMLSLLFLLFPPPVFSSSSPSRPRWVLQRVPVVLPQHTEDRPAPRFLSPARLEVTSSCDPECHKTAPRPSYWDLRDHLAYETLHSNGHLTETTIGIYGYNAKANTSPAYSSNGKAQQSHIRRRRQIFGHDGRFSIAGQNFLLKYPFSVAVKLSTGCSGTLVGDRHVLTAAHCVHDGKNYVKGAQRLRVGFLKPKQRDAQSSSLSSNFTNHVEGGPAPYTPPSNDKMKFQWIRAKRTHVPKGWIKGSTNDIGMDYDYALLELKKPHKRRHMKLGVSPPAQRLPGRRVQFSGFDNDRPGQLVYRFCRAGEETSDLLYQHCDAQPGASGSGVYARMWDGRRRRWERKVIGVFSGHQWVERQGASQEFNVAVRITPLKYAQICYWIKGNYVDCREG
ncbi:serine protease 23 [Myripristis murdjan]|uniref:Serine protease 23 n=1 Tax=Myripristis murdjan TaxID=586833 RepID=A0A667X4B7_9TELE|nr:serine protease 23 [Myripristis murdjan]